MKQAYLMTLVEEEDLTSSIFKQKASALDHIAKEFPEFKLVAEDIAEGVLCWRKHTGECLLLEKLRIED